MSAMRSSIVVADTKGQARDAAEAVEVTYKEKPAVTDAVEGARSPARRRSIPRPTNNLIFDWELGDADGDRRGDRQRPRM